VQRIGGRPELLWADFASPPPAEGPALGDAVAADYETLAHAFHETARYLLLHNPKAPPQPVPPNTHAAVR
jgi:hypothetical protein